MGKSQCFYGLLCFMNDRENSEIWCSINKNKVEDDMENEILEVINLQKEEKEEVSGSIIQEKGEDSLARKIPIGDVYEQLRDCCAIKGKR